jgi:hypothetical protein
MNLWLFDLCNKLSLVSKQTCPNVLYQESRIREQREYVTVSNLSVLLLQFVNRKFSEHIHAHGTQLHCVPI